MIFVFNGQEYYIDAILAAQLDTIAYNIQNDWDFVIVITGDRAVRVGKSVLAMTVCAYLCCTMQKMGLKTKYDLNDVYFDNEVIMNDAQNKPKYSINHYDEGREGLAASKAMTTFQEKLLDFFAECGQLNHIWVIVMPDFFELREQIAVARSEYLINVFRHEERVMRDIWKDGTPRPVVRFDRGYFEFFNRGLKKNLFDKARTTKRKSYALVRHNFHGRFTNQYALDEAAYKQKKRDSLTRFKQRHEDDTVVVSRADVIRDKIIFDLRSKGLTALAISKELENQYEYKLGESMILKIIKAKENLKRFEAQV